MNHPHVDQFTSSHTLDRQIISELHYSDSRSKDHKTTSQSSSKNHVEYGNNEHVTQLRIRVAVAENDLKHAIKERDDAINGNVLISKALGGMMSRRMDDELEKLRLEVTVLREHTERPGRELMPQDFPENNYMLTIYLTSGR